MMRLRNIVRGFVLCLLSSLLMTGCDVHEFPELDSLNRIPVQLDLVFDDSLPVYREEDMTSRAVSARDRHDIRYIINAYKIENARSDSRVLFDRFVVTRPESEGLDFTTEIRLPEGNYRLLVWTDFVTAGSVADRYYLADDFQYITISGKTNYIGSTDYRDGFRGEQYISITPDDVMQSEMVSYAPVTIDMLRPMAKFKFISVDYEEFVHQIIKQESAKEAAKNPVDINGEEVRAVDPKNYYVRFIYPNNIDGSFNMFTDKPAANVWKGIYFDSELKPINSNEVELGFDYIFVNGRDTKIDVAVEVYDRQGNLLSTTNSFKVPLKRSHLTIVRGNFLTAEATGGVGINPDYDEDDHNYEFIRKK